MKIYLLGIIILSIFATGCVEQPIGGERDEHGCLGPAGYTWDSEIGACIRTWELEEENQREATKIAVEHIGLKKGLTVVKVNVARCPGCFIIQFDTYGEQTSVSLKNWEIIESIVLTVKECEAEGGRTVNIVGGETCNSNEENIGEINEFISPNICCVHLE